MSPTPTRQGCPRTLLVGLVLQGVGAAGYAALILLTTVVWPREPGDPLSVGVAMGAPLLAFAFTCVVAWALRAGRPWAGGLALARAILSLVDLGALAISLVLLVLLPMLILPWFPLLGGAILVCIGGIQAFARSRRRGAGAPPSAATSTRRSALPESTSPPRSP